MGEREAVVLGVSCRGDVDRFPGSGTIRERILYRETVGKTPDGRGVQACLAHNPGNNGSRWYVCLVYVGGELYACKSHNQTATCQSVAATARGWAREVGAQLKAMTRMAGYYAFLPQSWKAVEAAVERAWPAGLTKTGGAEIPYEHGNAAVVARRDVKSQGEAARKEAEARGEGAQMSLFDL